MTNSVFEVEQIVGSLKKNSALPKHLDVSKIGGRYLISSYDDLASEIVSESVFTGMSNSKETATLKSLTEKVERTAIRDGARNGLKSCQTERSDGLACLPRIYPLAPKLARENALNEAIERFAWATWWDDPSVSFEILNYFPKFENLKNYGTLLEMQREAGFESPFCISPKISDEDKVVVILIAKLESGGFVSGGACGNHHQFEEVFMRGLDELFRHAMGATKMKQNNLTPSTFYESRLEYFASGKGDELVKKRLTTNGSKSVELPILQIDEEVPHRFDHDFVVHRCLFENQPPFVGGALERLCL